MWNWTAKYKHCCVSHEQSDLECILDGSILNRLHEVFLTVVMGCCLRRNVYVVFQNQFTTFSLNNAPTKARLKFLYRSVANTSVRLVRQTLIKMKFISHLSRSHICSLPCSGKFFRTDIDLSIWCNSSGYYTDNWAAVHLEFVFS